MHKLCIDVQMFQQVDQKTHKQHLFQFNYKTVYIAFATHKISLFLYSFLCISPLLVLTPHDNKNVYVSSIDAESKEDKRENTYSSN